MSHTEDRRHLKAKNPTSVPSSNVKPKPRFKSHFQNENSPAFAKFLPPDQIRSVPNLKVTIARSDETDSRQVDGPDRDAATVRLMKCSQKQEDKRLASIRRKLEQGQAKVKEVEVVVKQVPPIRKTPQQVVVLEDDDEPMLWEAIREQDRVAVEFEVKNLAEAEVVNRRLEELSGRLRQKQLEIELKEERKRAILAHKASFQTLLNVYMDTLAGFDGEFVAGFAGQEKSVLDLIESFNQLLKANDGHESTLADVDRTAEFCKQLEQINTEVIDLRNQMLKERGIVEEVKPQTGNPFNSDEVLKFYSEIKRFHEESQLKIQSLADDPSLFIYRKNLQTVVNVAVATLSGSCYWIEEQYGLLDKLLGGERVTVGDKTFVSTKGYPEAQAYCASMLAEKFVKARAMREAFRTATTDKLDFQSRAVKQLEETLDIHDIDHEKWIDLPRKYSRSSARFELPMDTRTLSTMTPIEYLKRHVVLCDDRKKLFHRIFCRNLPSDDGKPNQEFNENDSIPETETPVQLETFKNLLADVTRVIPMANFDKAMHEALGFHGTPEKIFEIRELLELNYEYYQEIPIDFRSWCGIVAFAERFIITQDREMDPCNELEMVDFESLERRIRSAKPSENLCKVLHIIKSN